jgi:hypothetical protein
MGAIYQTIPENSYRFKIWSFLHPDGEFMFFHTERKMKSMLKNGLVRILSERRKMAQLTFIPKGYGVDKDDIFMTTPKERKCVVCGISHSLTRHHVVPKEFRKHFPDRFKESNAHDILFVCDKHHEQYERKADILKREYFEKYNIESLCPMQTKVISQIKMRYNLISHLERMITDNNLHKSKIDYKLKTVLKLEQEAPLTLNQLKYLKENYKERLKVARNYFKTETSSGFLVDIIMKEDTLETFVRTWRQHFIDNAHPLYLPLGWSVNRRIYEKENAN